MNEQLYLAVMRELSDPFLLAMITRNVRELIERNLLTPDEADSLIRVLQSASHRAVQSEIALRKIKESLTWQRHCNRSTGPTPTSYTTG
jgi:hypothetical protein